MISTWYISAPSCTTHSFPRGSKRQMVVELRNWVSYQLTCGEWMLHVVMVTSHAIVLWFILSCRLLCSWFPRLWLLSTIVFEFILHKLVFFCLWVLADMHAIFFHWLMNDSVLFWLAFAMLGKIRRQYGLIFNFVVVCVCAVTLGHQRICAGTDEEHVAIFDKFQAHPSASSSVCIHRFSFSSSHPPAFPHCFTLYLTLSHRYALTYTLTTTGVIRKPTGDQFSHIPPSCSSHPLPAVSLRWLLSRHSWSLVCQWDIDLGVRGGQRFS